MRVVVITGTRKGIGRNLSEYYLNCGYIVCGCSRSKSDLVHENYRHFCLDISDESAVIDMILAIKLEFGKIDILLNNAGIASMNHVITTPYKSVKNIFETNFFGSFLFIREVSKVMINLYRKQYKNSNLSPFRIVNFATIAVPLQLEGEAIYAASKAAIINFTKVCAKELASFGITINAIGPTPIKTDLIKNVPKDKIELLLNAQSIKRFGTFDDICRVIDFFIDSKNDFITGQVIYLGGIND
ncbi:SDR family NAD(P)-dependent oxidoreductase [Helicobacter ibis]